jgi:hypothetical protein
MSSRPPHLGPVHEEPRADESLANFFDPVIGRLKGEGTEAEARSSRREPWNPGKTP